MNELDSVLEYNILGCQVKLANSTGDNIDAKDVIKLVNDEASKIREQMPNISDHQLAVLTALKLSNDKISSEGQFKGSLSQLRMGIVEALGEIEQVTATS